MPATLVYLSVCTDLMPEFFVLSTDLDCATRIADRGPSPVVVCLNSTTWDLDDAIRHNALVALNDAGGDDNVTGKKRKGKLRRRELPQLSEDADVQRLTDEIGAWLDGNRDNDTFTLVVKADTSKTQLAAFEGVDGARPLVVWAVM